MVGKTTCKCPTIWHVLQYEEWIISHWLHSHQPTVKTLIGYIYDQRTAQRNVVDIVVEVCQKR